MKAYHEALRLAEDNDERLEIISKLGINSLARLNDYPNYLHLLNRKDNERLSNQTDSEMYEFLNEEQQKIADTIKTREGLIGYIADLYELRSLFFKTQNNKTQNKDEYDRCLEEAVKKNLKLCPEGYCTAKAKFEVYPSAYANAYASQVCNGSKSDLRGTNKNSYEGREKDPNSGLRKNG